MTVSQLCEILKNNIILNESNKQPVELGLDEEILIQVLIDMGYTSWGRDILNNKIIYNWLNNFTGIVYDVEYERKLALILAIHMVYYNEKDICYLVKIAYRKLLHKIMEEKKISVEEAIKSTIFYPLGSVSESGPFLSYYFRKENQLSTDFFINSVNNISNSSAINNIVFLDDVSISGGQVMWYISQLKKDNLWNKIFEEKDIYALFLLATEEAKNKMKDKSINLCAPIEMDDRSKCFNEESAIYKIFDESIRDVIRLQSKHLAQVYGYSLLINQYVLNGEFLRLIESGKSVEEIGEKVRRDALGYDDSQMLFSFEYNTPNNCLPIIWIENEKWSPLFKRNDKLYISEVVGGIENETIYI